VTHGLSSAGYDLRVAERVELFPGACRLVDAMESFNMPLDLIGRLYTKSTWAREHIRVANTIIEPGWRGILRLELSQHFGEPIIIEAGTGVAQVVFDRLEEPTEQGYEGKYQDQGMAQDAIFER
jgi:dCTP deaminase